MNEDAGGDLHLDRGVMVEQPERLTFLFTTAARGIVVLWVVASVMYVGCRLSKLLH